MNLATRLIGSSLGKKYVMGITGCLLFLFVLGHMAGNLQVFLGPDAINAYAKLLHSLPEVLWAARIGLLILIVLHIGSAILLTLENRKARPVPYVSYNPSITSYAARTMAVSGFIVLAFIIYHLLHFTVQEPSINLISAQEIPDGSFVGLEDDQGRHDVFKMLVVGFSNSWVSLFYILGVGLLCYHLSHGLSSMFQSLGWKRKEPYGRILDRAAPIVSALIFIGYISIPVAILAGYGWDYAYTQ